MSSGSVTNVVALSPLMTPEELAVYLRMLKPSSVQTIYKWARRGKLPSRKINGLLRFHRDDIDAHIASQGSTAVAPSLTAFERARMRVRSLKTEDTVTPLSQVQKGRR